MATAGAVPSWVVLDRLVHLHKVDDEEEQDWATIECSETKAYVTVENGDESPDGTSPFRLSPFDGLELLVRVAEPPYPSALSIRLVDDPDKDDRRGFLSNVLLAGGGFLVLGSCLPDTRGSNSYIVLDAPSGSLAMISTLSLRFRPSVAYTPLPLRRPDGGYVLVLIAMDMMNSRPADGSGYLPEVICLMPSWLPFDHPWQLKTPLFPPEKPRLFGAHEIFSFQGHALWVDLGRGILSCDCEDILLSSNGDVQFRYIDLPMGCKVDFDPSYHRALPSEYRAIRGMGNSIRFVSIEGYTTMHRRDMVLCMWTLIVPSSSGWRKVGEISVGELWEQKGFKTAGLPTHVPPTRPMLSSHEDGVVYFLLGDFYEDEDKDEKYIHMFSINLLTRKFVSSWRIPSSCCPQSNLELLMESDILKDIGSHRLLPIAVPHHGEAKRMKWDHHETVMGLTSKEDLGRAEKTSGMV
ncbi:uncharacterized protein LOC102720419 isoform X2 [Oryza brachyantha]|uniref:DUF1618 domain-containing protein n=1 Tax=Oryza brachyantha TaxID=4533 RepID=J3LSC3_ORYBR|nr:uncharacterized protein LOC102720419 isoform X2 [Oryza brachyantha]